MWTGQGVNSFDNNDSANFSVENKKKKQNKKQTKKNFIEPFRIVPQSVESKLGRTGESEFAEIVTRASKSSEASESREEAAPLSSFPPGQYALSSPAELRLDWLKRDCSQSTFRGVCFFEKTQKPLRQISFSWSSPFSNLKVSIAGV